MNKNVPKFTLINVSVTETKGLGVHCTQKIIHYKTYSSFQIITALNGWCD